MEENVQYTKQIQSCILPPHIQDICIAYIISWLEQSGYVIKVHLEIKSFCGGGFFFFPISWRLHPIIHIVIFSLFMHRKQIWL